MVFGAAFSARLLSRNWSTAFCSCIDLLLSWVCFQVFGPNAGDVVVQVAHRGFNVTVTGHMLNHADSGPAMGCVGDEGMAVLVRRDAPANHFLTGVGANLVHALPGQPLAPIA